jgi:serine/threonine protein kinase
MYYGPLLKYYNLKAGGYSSPQILNNEPYTNKTDVWSFGIILYVLLFKEFPFKAEGLS